MTYSIDLHHLSCPGYIDQDLDKTGTRSKQDMLIFVKIKTVGLGFSKLVFMRIICIIIIFIDNYSP
jgi:hypothetical protein